MGNRNVLAALKEFPLFMEGCKVICLDNGCGYQPDTAHEVNPEADTLEYTVGIAFTESVLKRLEKKTVKQFIPELPKMRYYEDIKPSDKVIELVYNGFNDSCELVLRKLGLSDHEIWLVEHVFDQFFEGELHKRLTRPCKRKHPQGGNFDDHFPSVVKSESNLRRVVPINGSNPTRRK